jgi:protein SCO1
MPTRRDFRVVLLLLAGLALLGGCARRYALHGIAEMPPREAPEFTLTDQTGQPFHLKDTRGKVTVLFFGYTSCPDVCPTTLATLAEVRRQLGADGTRLQVAFISVDPERDTEAVLQRYVAAFNASFAGLRGAAAELGPIFKAYGVTAVRSPLSDSAQGYEMVHTADTFVIDPQGRLVERLPYGTPVEQILSDVRALMR